MYLFLYKRANTFRMLMRYHESERYIFPAYVVVSVSVSVTVTAVVIVITITMLAMMTMTIMTTTTTTTTTTATTTTTTTAATTTTTGTTTATAAATTENSPPKILSWATRMKSSVHITKMVQDNDHVITVRTNIDWNWANEPALVCMHIHMPIMAAS